MFLGERISKKDQISPSPVSDIRRAPVIVKGVSNDRHMYCTGQRATLALQ